MYPVYYYRDGEKVKGPFGEADVLKLYKMAEFTSDFEFQMRPAEDDENAPFTTLNNLIRENGHRNPFRNESEQLDRLIAARQKDLDELSNEMPAFLSKKASMEKRIAEMERKIEEKLRERREKRGETEGEETKRDDSDVTVLPSCDDCGLVCCSHKQLVVHSHRSSCASRSEGGECERWKREDEQRLAAGQRIFKRMSADEIGSARPQIDFVEDLHLRISKKMVFEFDGEGKDKARTWIKSEEAKKMSDRFVKHLKEAKGHLVCTRCKSACRSHAHFIVHLITYDHRLKVKGTPLELLSLLVGFYHKEEYLAVPDPSELDEDLDMDTTPSASGPPVLATPMPDLLEMDEYDEEKKAAHKQLLIMKYSQTKAMYCKLCDIIFSSYKQYLLHCTTEEHEEKMGGENPSRRLEELFTEELRKWRWEDRVNLPKNKRLYESMTDEDKEDARPTNAFIAVMAEKLEKVFKKIDDQTEHAYLNMATWLGGKVGTRLMERLEDHLNESTRKKYVCHPCKVAFDESANYFIHCQMSRHLLLTISKPEKFLSTLIGVHKRDLYFH